MAFKHAASFLLLLAANTFILPASANSEMVNCAEVDFATFNVLGTANSTPRIGVKGMYASTANGSCVYVDASLGSAFAQQYPDEHTTFINAATKAVASSGLTGGLEFLGDVATRDMQKLEERERGCGQTCGGASCDSCKCKWDYTVCVRNYCYSVYICK